MTPEMSDQVLGVFLIFCRVGSCLMLLPGLSSARIPLQVRLFLAFAISLALSPALLEILLPLVRTADDATKLSLILTEVLNGLFIGLLGRIFMIALQFAGHVIAQAIGMGQLIGTPMEDSDPAPALVTLVTMTATTLIFILNLHAEIARALVASYSAMPPLAGFSVRPSLVAMTDNLDEAFLLCLRISSPFVLYAVIVNFAIGLANKLTPQIPIYFISLPFVLAGGLFIFTYTIGDFLTLFMQDFSRWVANG
ncbi:flagellar biosynthetic protein FliR [Mangrovibrevibacter kandeliae]|uniref:flagellar biosynthetic protein FliR n=1 Tax=Mangrovibrevibacter kandeliae TaxID=2968473 RepID=UPI0021176F31|nr:MULTISPECIES: flagellar biosynthetic protein FliR [unclassified Aurantimonas]MCQ8780940.1 flagellar biosynthetic protein FliR [Aurantimonas sp. CSK15Z-1]MCW4113721.1 flagellar biosynthetic protein FliR [Aurantimonas sp. MSK8Z-1]